MTKHPLSTISKNLVSSTNLLQDSKMDWEYVTVPVTVEYDGTSIPTEQLALVDPRTKECMRVFTHAYHHISNKTFLALAKTVEMQLDAQLTYAACVKSCQIAVLEFPNQAVASVMFGVRDVTPALVFTNDLATGSLEVKGLALTDNVAWPLLVNDCPPSVNFSHRKKFYVEKSARVVTAFAELFIERACFELEYLSSEFVRVPFIVIKEALAAANYSTIGGHYDNRYEAMRKYFKNLETDRPSKLQMCIALFSTFTQNADNAEHTVLANVSGAILTRKSTCYKYVRDKGA